MKKYLFIFIITLLFVACKKEFHFTSEDITERDAMGNLTGNINPDDWQLKPLSEATDFDQMVFNSAKGIYGYNFNNYENDCLDTFQFELKAFPNPMQKKGSYNLNFMLNTNLIFERHVNMIVDKQGNHITGSAGLSTFPEKTNINPLVNRDFIYYYILITADGCAFFGKGNVIGAKK